MINAKCKLNLSIHLLNVNRTERINSAVWLHQSEYLAQIVSIILPVPIYDAFIKVK